MKINKYRIQLGLIIILAVFVLSLLLSLKATPDMTPFFALKRGQEKVFLKLKANPLDKVDYMSSLLDSRLEELQTIVKNKNYDYVLRSALRYSTLAGQITDMIIANNLTDKIEGTKVQFINHGKLLDELYVVYPKNLRDNVEWKYIQDDFNYLQLYLDKLETVK